MKTKNPPQEKGILDKYFPHHLEDNKTSGKSYQPVHAGAQQGTRFGDQSRALGSDGGVMNR